MTDAKTTPYSNRVTLDTPFADARTRIIEALKAEGFGVLSEIDMQATLQKKRNVDVGHYTILGACHPPFAERALNIDREAGLLLPCNVAIYADGDSTVVTILDPIKAISIAENPDLETIANEANAKLTNALAALA